MTYSHRFLFLFGMSCSVFVFNGCGKEQTSPKAAQSIKAQVTVIRTQFEPKQRLGSQSNLMVVVKNSSQTNAKNVAVTLTGLNHRVQNTEFADEQRPVWVVDDGPKGGVTASATTWTLGTLPPGRTRTFLWKLTAVTPGSWKIHYRIAPDLQTEENTSGTIQALIQR